MDLRPLLIAVVAGGVTGLSGAAQAGPAAVYFSASHSAGAKSTVYGIMGEVARPGVYESVSALRLSELVQMAGGLTLEAGGSVRVFRAGRLAQQLFISTGSSPKMLPGDLILIESRRAPRRPPAAKERDRSETAAATAHVQIALLNLVDRPVIVKMTREQASPAQIVRLLNQADELAARVRVIAPTGGGTRPPSPMAMPEKPLESGSVLVFPTRLIRRESLPLLPKPIADGGETRLGSSTRVDPQKTPATASAAPPGDARLWAASADTAKGGEDYSAACQHAQRDVTTSPRRSRQPSAAGTGRALEVRHLAMLDALDHRRPPSMSRATIALLWCITATTVTVLLVTVLSIARRWINLARLRPSARQPALNAAAIGSTFGIDLPSAPVPSAVSGVGRRLRVDACQPITRLGLDLAMRERTERAIS